MRAVVRSLLANLRVYDPNNKLLDKKIVKSFLINLKIGLRQLIIYNALTADIAGQAETFKHDSAEGEQVLCEDAVTNALSNA